jgi:glycosyltransferase involved in cell wall biosynthesis
MFKRGIGRRTKSSMKLAFIVSHPIQYYAPLYRRLAKRDDVQIKVFFTWHGGGEQLDHGFRKTVAWDIPVTEGYEYEVVPNIARDPNSHHFFGLRNPSLVQSVLNWRPDAVHITGYAYASHLGAMRAFARRGVPVLFRGDSHLLDERLTGWRWQLKRTALSKIYSWPAVFLYVGEANKEYYRAFGVPDARLHYCPHSIEVERFAEPNAEWEQQATAWKAELKIEPEKFVLLFAGKFEDRKRPLPLMKAILEHPDPRLLLIMVGDGELGPQVRKMADQHPQRFRVIPFQNQSRMPVVYRLGDLVVLPSATGETWGLAANEALACGRAVILSNRVGCHADVVQAEAIGKIFAVDDWADFCKKLASFSFTRDDAVRQKIKKWAVNWSIKNTEDTLVETLKQLVPKKSKSSGR